MMKRLFCIFSLLCIPLLARGDESILNNGTFDQGIVANSSPEVPKGWAIGSVLEEPTGERWMELTVTDQGKSAVEIKGSESNPGAYFLYQDVPIGEKQRGDYLFRWKARGNGVGLAGVYPREGSGSFVAQFKKFDVQQDFQEYEVFLNIPDDTTAVRVILQVEDSKNTITFSDVHLIPAEEVH